MCVLRRFLGGFSGVGGLGSPGSFSRQLLCCFRAFIGVGDWREGLYGVRDRTKN